jgi:uncharacterized protein (TIGR03085 family)
MSTERPDSAPSTASLAARERAALATLLDEVGPDAPTLCAGWTTRDLAAHLVVREGHPAAAGLVIPPLAGWLTRQQASTAEGDYAQLVERFRAGPPVLSPMRLPGADAAANTFEHFVHHEDVRRAAPGWTARELPDDDERTLWQQLSRRLRLYLRSAPVPVRLTAPDLGSVSAGDTASPAAITITAAPSELVLYLHGRRDHALVTIDGTDQSRDLWERHTLAV